MNKDQDAIMEKARSKRQRRAQIKVAGKTPDEKKAQVADPNATLTEKAIDMVQGAAAQVGDFVMAAAQKIKGTAGDVSLPSGHKKT